MVLQCVEQGASISRVIVFIEKTSLPFIVYQKQFPIRVACGMTINKAQGQSTFRSRAVPRIKHYAKDYL